MTVELKTIENTNSVWFETNIDVLLESQYWFPNFNTRFFFVITVYGAIVKKNLIRIKRNLFRHFFVGKAPMQLEVFFYQEWIGSYLSYIVLI
jgi:hypothetical protein